MDAGLADQLLEAGLIKEYAILLART